ncbi:MAG: DUF6153 family protein [Rhodoglobus sp.]
MRGNVLLARLRNSRGGRLAIALLAVPVILVGLLAMHVLTTGEMGDTGIAVASASHHDRTDAPPSTNATMAAMASTPGAPAPPEDCSGMCGPGHEMLGMVCGLALLITVVLITLQLIFTRWQPLRRVAITIAATAAALAPLPPPSLHILSISRT